MKGMDRTEARSIRVGAVRVLKGRHAGRVGYYDDDDGDHTVVHFGEPIHSGDVLIERLWSTSSLLMLPNSPDRQQLAQIFPWSVGVAAGWYCVSISFSTVVAISGLRTAGRERATTRGAVARD